MPAVPVVLPPALVSALLPAVAVPAAPLELAPAPAWPPPPTEGAPPKPPVALVPAAPELGAGGASDEQPTELLSRTGTNQRATRAERIPRFVGRPWNEDQKFGRFSVPL